MKITRASMLTGVRRTKELPVTEQQMMAYYDGGLLQVVFPELSPGDREFIKSGITDEEWDTLKGET